MSVKLLRYDQLMVAMAERAGQANRPGSKSIPNVETALRDFLRERQLDPANVIGSTLRDGFSAALEAHIEGLRKRGESDRYIANRMWALRHWHSLMRALEHDAASAAGRITPLTVAIRSLFADGSRKYSPTARDAGISVATMKRWLDGHEPRRGMEKKLASLEMVCGLKPGALTELLPYRPLRDRGGFKVDQEPAIAHRHLMSALTQDTYRLRDADVPDSLVAEWRDLVEARTGRRETSTKAATSPNGNGLTRLASIRSTGERLKGRRWRVRRPAPGEGTDFERRMHFVQGMSCPTAFFNWEQAASYFGWLMLEQARGGAGMPASDALTLGNFANADLFIRFLDWRIERSQNINNGHLNLVNMAVMLLHPETGFLPRRTAMGKRMGCVDESAWRDRCMEAFEVLRQIRADIKPEVSISRDPKEPLQKALALPMPLDPFVEACKRMSNRRRTGGIREAIDARDLLLLSLLMSNPLRVETMRRLTYRDDNTGSLYRDAKGWRIKLPKDEFKNIHGAAKKSDYDQAVDPSVWPHIEEYLRLRHRFGSTTDLLFVSSRRPNCVWETMDNAVFRITQVWVEGCPGVGPHGLRHIVATSVLLKTEGNILLAAKLLHDEPSTVEANYVHILSQFADRGRAAVLGPVLERMHADLTPISL